MKKTATSNRKQRAAACGSCACRPESAESMQRPTVSLTLESLEKALA